MPLDPQIPLQVNIPQQAPMSPLASIGQLMQLRGIDSEIALRNAQAQQAQQQSQNVAAEARQRQRDLADQNYLQQASLDPDIHKRLALGDTSPIAGKVQIKTEQAIQANALKMATDRAALNTTQLTQRNTGAAEIGSGLAGLLNLKDADGNPDLAQINENLPSVIDGLTKSGALTAVGIDPAKLQGQQVTSVDQLHQFAASMGAETSLNDKILAQKEAAAKPGLTNAQAAEATGKGAEAQANADQKTIVNHLMQSALANPQAGNAAIQSALGTVDPPAAKSFSDQYNSAMSLGKLDEAQAAVRGAVEHAVSLSPATRANKAATAHDEAAAAEGVHIDQAIRTEMGKVQAMGSMQLAPAQQAIADKLATGDFNPTLLARRPDGEALIRAAIAKNPNWTPQTYATKKAFEDPQSKQSQNLGTISRIVGHIGRFEQNSKDLGVSPSMLIGVNLTGKAAATQEDAHAIAAELEKLVSGGMGTEGQTQSWAKALTSTRPDIRQQAVDEISQLIGSQYEGMNQTYKTTVGSDLPIEKYVSSNGRAWMSSKGISAGGNVPPHLVPAAAHAYKAGDTRVINGKTYTRDANGNWN